MFHGIQQGLNLLTFLAEGQRDSVFMAGEGERGPSPRSWGLHHRLSGGRGQKDLDRQSCSTFSSFFFFNASAFWSGEIAKVVKIHQNERIQNGNDTSCLGFEFNQGFQLLSLICTETLTADFSSPKPF